MATYEITVGRLLARPIRDYLAQAKFAGRQIEWIESTGWIERTFTIKGSNDDLHIIDTDMQEWHARINENKSK